MNDEATTAAAVPGRIGYLGPPGTHSEEALRAALGDAVSSTDLVALESNRDVVLAVEQGAVDAGFVPIENLVEGAVTETLDALVHDATHARIVGELVWPIHHCLISAAGTELADVQMVRSHPQALAQCARFLATELGGAARLAQVSTSEAVRSAIEQGEGQAAIGSAVAAEIYGGEVLREAVEDVAGNKTRFVWLACEQLDPPAAAGTANSVSKTSIVFSGFNDTSPGGLVGILSEFAYRAVNMSKIESRPERSALGHYLFFVDLDGDQHDDAVAQSIEGVRTKVRDLRVLGSFSVREA